MQMKSSFGQYTVYTTDQLSSELGVSLDKGLSEQEAKARQEKYGLNELPSMHSFWWRILLSQFTSPFIYLLLGIIVVTFFLGDVNTAIVIAACVLLNTLVGFYQEFKASRSLYLLKQYLIAKVTVLRDGKEQEVSSSSLVPGDILLLYPGDIIPADVRFFKVDHVQVDESVLTGESVPVQKQAEPLSQPVDQVFQAANIGFSGTTLMSGRGMGVVILTGMQASLGIIAQLTSQSQRISSFSLGIGTFSRFIFFIIIVTIALVFIAHLLLARGPLDIINLIIFAIALGVTIIPEALPVVTTFGFARGALLLAQHKVVVKRLSSIEDLGSIEILCVDKTGTLTENKLSIAGFCGPERDILTWGTLGSGLSIRGLSSAKGFDAIFWHGLTGQEQALLREYEKVSEIPFDPERRRSLVLYKHKDIYELVVRGSATDVFDCCSFDQAAKKEIDAWVEQESKKGNRVIAIARKEYIHLNQTKIDAKLDEHAMTLVGLISFEDPLKSTARGAIEKAKKLGLSIKILSGDNEQVCGAIATKVGLIQNPTQVISGDYFAKQTTDVKRKLAENGVAFARVIPQQKYEIIKLLQEKYNVGYMGDGINDAPALKIAQVALAVDDAADIARDAADIILLHRSLRVIINGIEEGRIIFANTIKYLKITLAAGFGHFYALAIASLLIDYLPMLPVQLLILNFMTDIPLIGLSTDTVSPQEIRSPQKYDIKSVIILATVLGLVIMTFDFILFGLFHKKEPAVLQTYWFMSCLLNELAFAFSVRSALPFYKAKPPSAALVILSLIVAVISIGLPFTSFGQKWAHFVRPEWHNLAIIFALMIGCFITTELVKRLYYALFKNGTL
jgi:P-type Mg2+ transporter